ncbi:MAG: hypothetical protein JKY60_03895 [Kordiimonadaceae bacterium]|nr:hypothetical protein [Kordiimonadaceae bacterium]
MVWNWAAFLFGPLWCVYRNLAVGWLVLGVLFILSIVEAYFLPFSIPSWLIAMPIAFYFGFFGNSFLVLKYLDAVEDENGDTKKAIAPNPVMVIVVVSVVYVAGLVSP